MIQELERLTEKLGNVSSEEAAEELLAILHNHKSEFTKNNIENLINFILDGNE